MTPQWKDKQNISKLKLLLRYVTGGHGNPKQQNKLNRMVIKQRQGTGVANVIGYDSRWYPMSISKCQNVICYGTHAGTTRQN